MYISQTFLCDKKNLEKFRSPAICKVEKKKQDKLVFEPTATSYSHVCNNKIKSMVFLTLELFKYNQRTIVLSSARQPCTPARK